MDIYILKIFIGLGDTQGEYGIMTELGVKTIMFIKLW